MPLVQDSTNPFKIVDRTDELRLVPQTWTLLGDSGLFRDEYLATTTVTFEERNGSLSYIGDAVRGSKPQAVAGEIRKLHSYSTVHHPVMDALYPSDVNGVSAPNSNGQRLDQKDAALARKVEKIRRMMDVTKEIARFKTLSTGQIWAPNGTVAADFYTDFGKTKNVVDFVFGTTTTDIIAKCEAVIADFQAKATEGQVINRVIGYASPTFFSNLIKHNKVATAYTYYSATDGQSILRNRAGGAGLYRRFSFAGIDFIEVPTILAGETLVPAGDCIFVAQDDADSFVTYYSPANRFGYVNTVAENGYLWTFEDPRMTEITVEGELNMLNFLRKPEFVARGHSSN